MLNLTKETNEIKQQNEKLTKREIEFLRVYCGIMMDVYSIISIGKCGEEVQNEE